MTRTVKHTDVHHVCTARGRERDNPHVLGAPLSQALTNCGTRCEKVLRALLWGPFQRSVTSQDLKTLTPPHLQTSAVRILSSVTTPAVVPVGLRLWGQR